VLATAGRPGSVGRAMPPVLVAVISIPENVPEQPADDPVLLLEAVRVAAYVVEHACFGPRVLIDVQNLAVGGGLVELGVAERRLGALLAAVSQNVRHGHHSVPADAGFFLLNGLSEWFSREENNKKQAR
jgi:hypothetical protein